LYQFAFHEPFGFIVGCRIAIGQFVLFFKLNEPVLDLFGKCNSHLEKASFVYDAVWTPLSKWRGGGGEAVQKSALPFSQRVFSEEV